MILYLWNIRVEFRICFVLHRRNVENLCCINYFFGSQRFGHGIIFKEYSTKTKEFSFFSIFTKEIQKSFVAVIQHIYCSRLELQWLLNARSKFLGAKLTFPLTDEIDDSLSATVSNCWKTSFACCIVRQYLPEPCFNEVVYCLLKRTDIIVADFMEIQQSVLLFRSLVYISFFPFFFFSLLLLPSYRQLLFRDVHIR